MIPVCLYFQAHQPYRLRPYGYFDVGREHAYFDDAANREILARVAERCYRPATRMLRRLLGRHEGFAVSFSLSGCLLEQLRDFEPGVIEAFGELARTGRAEFLAETSHHSLAWIASRVEFEEQVALHGRLLREILGVTPRVFRNTELIYGDALARWADERGYAGALADGVPALLGSRSPRHVYRAPTPGALAILTRDYRMSDDIAFRFSDRSWSGHPLTGQKYDGWVSGSEGEILSLFMDFETFGEHQRAETGIFEFFEAWVGLHLARSGARFVTPSQAVAQLPRRGVVSSPDLLSWADDARDLSAWQGNELQRDALARLFALETRVKASGSSGLLSDFRRLTTSDHYYYMATPSASSGSSSADAEVHAYFSPWDSPYEAYMTFRHVVADLEGRLDRPRRVVRPSRERHPAP